MGSRTAMGAVKGLKGLGMALALVLGCSAAPGRSISSHQCTSDADARGDRQKSGRQSRAACRGRARQRTSTSAS